jgi:hypothetical protein
VLIALRRLGAWVGEAGNEGLPEGIAELRQALGDY